MEYQITDNQAQIRIYSRKESAVFCKTHEDFGGLSNMAGGYKLHLDGVEILTSEVLYQACRYPHLPAVQKVIVGQRSSMTAKMKSKSHYQDSRLDWDRVRVNVMRWSLQVKLVQNWEAFGKLLESTGNLPIVELSRRDDFGGAKVVEDELIGVNVLGRLLMELRQKYLLYKDIGFDVEPLGIVDFLFLEKPIGAISGTILTALDSKHLLANETIRVKTSVKEERVAVLFGNYSQTQFGL